MLLKIKRSTPYLVLREWNKALRRRVNLPRYLGNEHVCPVCDTRLRAFKPIWKSYLRRIEEVGYVYPLSRLETFDAAIYSCPACDASMRERLLALYLDERFRALDSRRRYLLVEFAPSPSGALRRKLARSPFIAYRSADLFFGTADDRIDIADMPSYGAGSVDIFLCSHVLEHVAQDRKAMGELCRILKPDGFGLVMVPLVQNLDETHEDSAIDTPALRWKYYGQDDHLRQYGKRDFLRRLSEAGLHVAALGVEHFGETAFRRAGLASNSVLYVARKKLA